MRVALLSAGPSLGLYEDHRGTYDLVVAINTSAMKYPCDWWCFKDQPFMRHVGEGRRYGLPAEPRPTGLCILGKRIENEYRAWVRVDENGVDEWKIYPFDPDVVAWANTCQIRNMADWEFNGFTGHGQKSHDMWKKLTIGMALMLCYQLGASSIDCFGVDMDGIEDYAGRTYGNRTDERWEMERPIFEHVKGWLEERDITVTRHLPVMA